MILRLAAHAMATRFELVLTAGDRATDEARLRAIGEAALDEIAQCERAWSRFDRGSTLTDINHHAHARWIEVDADTFELLELSAEVHRASDGAFDPTVAPLMEALGFWSPAATGTDPAVAARAIGMTDVLLDPDRRAVRFKRPDIALDLGAIAKGRALDHAAAVLRECGVDTALLHAGTSTVVALGAPPGEPGWRVALGADAPATATAVLRDAALSVSGPHGREARQGDTRIGHVLDPRTAQPAASAALAAVITSDAGRADAWSTALLVTGEHTTVTNECSTTALLRDGRWTVHGSLPPNRIELTPTTTPLRA